MSAEAIAGPSGVLMRGAVRPPGQALLFPYVETRRVRLRAALASDGTDNYEFFLRNGMNNLPNLDMFLAAYSRDLASHSAYSRDLAAHFVIQQRRDNMDVGFGGLFELSPAGHVEVGLYTDLNKADIGIGAEATLLFINYAFATWRVRKVYMRTTEASLRFFGGTLASISRHEAVLPEHQYFRGMLWDVYIYAVYRPDWEARGRDVLERLVGGPRRATQNGAGR
jgi:RimJ/RimL family protein N-acetyltransferase